VLCVGLSVQRTAPQGSPRTPATCIAATTPELIVRILNSVFYIFKFLNNSVALTRYILPDDDLLKIGTCRSTLSIFMCFNEIDILD